MLPEWDYPYFREQYTGPYLSDGKFQQSVAHGKAKPRSRVDELSRAHDTAYALAESDADRRKADRIYYEATRSMSFVPRVFGNMVLYGNDPALLFVNPDGGGGVKTIMGNAIEKNTRAYVKKKQNLRREQYASMYGEDAASLYYDGPPKQGKGVYDPLYPTPNGGPLKGTTATGGGPLPGTTATTWTPPHRLGAEETCSGMEEAGTNVGFGSTYGIGGFVRPPKRRRKRVKTLF